MRLLALLLFLASTLFLTFSPVYAADFYMEDSHTLVMEGEIGINDFETFANIVGQEDVTSLRLESSGGLFAPSVGIGILVNDLKIDTEVYGTCLSSCAYIALAGNSLTLADTAIFGIHAPFLIFLDDTRQVSEAAEKDAMWYLGRIDIPLKFSKKVMTYGPHDMWYLNEKMLEDYKVFTK